MIEHVPAATSVTEVPETVQTPELLETSVIARPLEADADREMGPWSTWMSAGCAKVIVCEIGAAVTWNDRVTSGAPPYVVSPACEAVIEQTPTAMSVTDAPEAVHTLVVVLENTTGSPLDAEAETVTGP